MTDWERFLAEVPWFVEAGQTAEAGVERAWERGGLDGLPELSTLLREARLTPVSVGGNDYELLAWGAGDDHRGWLCEPPRDAGDAAIHSRHRDFWALCGGIVERFGEPVTWWMNQNQVLTADATQVDLAGALDDYAWLWENDGLKIPIQPDDYYVVAVEANGNLTLVHREAGNLLVFAPDHAFPDVTPLPGCPPYSLLTINTVPDLETWLETCASRWGQARGV